MKCWVESHYVLVICAPAASEIASHQMIYHQGVQYRPEHIIQNKMVDPETKSKPNFK